jgi:dihydrodipicolinate synthase/N-acetylneuraminate lyase
MAKEFRGVFAIPVSPFDKKGNLDEAALRRIVDFCIAGGAHGIVTPVNASEFYTLTDDERKRTAEVAVKQVNGRIPVVIGTSGISTRHAVDLSRHAASVGADAIIAMPPYLRKAPMSEIFDYYKAISDAVNIPIFIQDYIAPMGTPMSADFLARLLREIEHVNYLKEEVPPAGQMMTAVAQRAGAKLKGTMGGAAGRYLLDEYRRGACGTMPACEVVDLHVQLWNLLESKDEKGAREFFKRLLPLLNLESLYSFTVYREVLRRRGVIDSTFTRAPGAGSLDEFDHKELDTILEDLKPLFRM